MKRILIIYCDIKNGNPGALKNDGTELIVRCTAETALKAIKLYKVFRLVIVNGSDSEIEDFEFCRKIQSLVQCPIIYSPQDVLTANNILGFEMYKDDYIFKPFLIEELIEKAISFIKEEFSGGRSEGDNVYTFGDLEIDSENHEIYKNRQKIGLSPLEYKLLLFLINNEGKILTNEQIINCVWGIAYGDTRMLRVAIRRLRSKIDPDGRYIITIRGKGYKFVIPENTAANY